MVLLFSLLFMPLLMCLLCGTEEDKEERHRYARIGVIKMLRIIRPSEETYFIQSM